MRNTIFILLLLLFSNSTIQAQFFTSGGRTTGFYGGYKKTSPEQVLLKNRYWIGCTSSNGFAGVVWDSVGIGSSSLWPIIYKCVFMLNNIDSSSKAIAADPVNGSPTTPNGSVFWLKPVQKSCNICHSVVNEQDNISAMLRYHNELTTDTSFYAAPIIPAFFTIDSNMTSISLFHGVSGMFDSMYLFMKNIQPFNLLGGYPRPYIYSRVYRWQDYTNISSPDLMNKNVILAVKNKPLHYNLGVVDKEHDVVKVVPLITSLDTNELLAAYPTDICNNSLLPLTPAQQNIIKQTLQYHSAALQYYPGYSAAQPFGNNANYLLDSNTAEISVIPQDTGLFFLSYTVKEYRDNRLLGDIMYFRLAYVVDSDATLPVVSDFYDLNPGIANDVPNQIITVCPGQLLSYKVDATSLLSSAKIVLSSNASQSVPTIITSTAGQGTDNATITYTWIPLPADVGTHYIYTDVVDTACGPHHLPVHQSKVVTIKVLGQTGISPSAPVSCAGAPVVLTAQGGFDNFWSVISGDTTLPCIQCSQITVQPSVTTTYVLTGLSDVCGQRTDTFTLRNIPPYTIVANDTSFSAAIPASYHLSVTVTPPAGYYKYTWSPAAKVNNAFSPDPIPINTVNHNTYTITVTDSFNCFTQTDTVHVNANTAGVEDLSTVKGIEIYPNPFSSTFSIKTPVNGTLEIITIDGRKLKSYVLKAGTSTLQLPKDTPEGVYIARFTSNELKQTISRKIEYKRQ